MPLPPWDPLLVWRLHWRWAASAYLTVLALSHGIGHPEMHESTWHPNNGQKKSEEVSAREPEQMGMMKSLCVMSKLTIVSTAIPVKPNLDSVKDFLLAARKPQYLKLTPNIKNKSIHVHMGSISGNRLLHNREYSFPDLLTGTQESSMSCVKSSIKDIGNVFKRIIDRQKQTARVVGILG